MKRKLSVILASVFAFLLVATPVLAAYTASITLVNTSTTSYSMLSCNLTSDNFTPSIRYMADNGYFDSVNGTDTRVLSGTAERKHMLADDRIMFALPVAGTSSQTLTFATHSSNLTSFPIIVGHGGNITASDAINLELGGNFTVEVAGWWNTDNGTEKNAVLKNGAFRISVNPTVSEKVDVAISGSAVRFDGSNDFILQGTVLDTPSANVSFEWWFSLENNYSSANASSKFFWRKDNIAASDVIMSYLNSADGSLTLQGEYNNGGAWTLASDIVSWTGGDVHNVACTYDGTVWKMYIDGALQTNTVAQTGFMMNGVATDFHLGSDEVGAGGIESTIDEFRISDIARTQAEITASYNAWAFYENDTNTIMLWHLDEGTGVTATDETGTYSGTLTNGPIWTTGLVLAAPIITATGVSSGEHEVTVDLLLNYLLNGNFEVNNPPDDWNGTRVTVARDNVDYVVGNYSVNITCNDGGGVGPSYLRQDMSSAIRAFLSGKTVTLGFYYKVPAANPYTVQGNIRDNNGTSALTLTKDGAWHWGEVERTLAAGLTDLEVDFWVKNTAAVDTTNYMRVDGAVLIVGDGMGPGGNFIISLDGVEQDATFSDNTTPIPDNSNQWVMMQNNVLSYADNITISVNGTDELYYCPQNILVAVDNLTATLPDRTNIVNNGTIAWGSNPSGIEISMGGLVYTEEPYYTGTTLATPDVVPAVHMPATMYQDETLWTLTGDPLYTWMLTWSNLTATAGIQIPLILMWFIAFLIMTLVAFAMTYKFTNNLLISGIAALAVLGYGVSRGLIPFWVIIILVFALVGLVTMERRTQL